jgi:tetratricopeptide (TPR) repeat protein
VILYELLTGSPPFTAKQLREAAFDQMLQMIRQVEPPKPSTRLSSAAELPSIAANRKLEPKRLTRLVHGELDWVVMKCLEKDRTRRYETANGLAMDLTRYLSDEPVSAGAPSTLYRLRKFVRRNKGPVLAATTIALLLVGGVVGTGWALLRERHARKTATAAAVAEKVARETAMAREAETKAVLNFLENRVLAAARPEGQEGGLGRDVTLRKAVEAAVPFVEKSFADQPLIQARLRQTLAASFIYLGDAKLAAEQAEAARALYARHRGLDDPDTLGAMNNLAITYALLGRHTDALKLEEESLALRKRRLGPQHRDTLAGMANLASRYAALGRYAEALKLREETLALYKSTLGPDHPDTLRAMGALANSYATLGRQSDAVQVFETTWTLQKSRLGADHPGTLVTMNNLASCYGDLGRHAEALKLKQEALELRKAKLGPDHPDTLLSISNLAKTYADLDQHANAVTHYEEALKVMSVKLGANHPTTLATTCNLALSYVALGHHDEALPIIDDCLSRATSKPVHPVLIPLLLEKRLLVFEKRRDPTGCLETAEKWDALKRTDAKSLHFAAIMRAVCSAVIRDTDPTPSGQAKAQEQADHSMMWLKRAVAAGFKDAAQIQRDAELDILRDRDDFKALVAELQAHTPSAPATKPTAP